MFNKNKQHDSHKISRTGIGLLVAQIFHWRSNWEDEKGNQDGVRFLFIFLNLTRFSLPQLSTFKTGVTHSLYAGCFSLEKKRKQNSK